MDFVMHIAHKPNLKQLVKHCALEHPKAAGEEEVKFDLPQLQAEEVVAQEVMADLLVEEEVLHHTDGNHNPKNYKLAYRKILHWAICECLRTP
jgi:hypothetical protein